MPKKRVHRPPGHPARRPAVAADARMAGTTGAAASRPPAAGASRGAARSRTAGPAPQPRPANGARARFEEASRPALVRLRALPVFVVPSILAITLFVGLVVGQPWAGLLLVLISAFLAWLTALSWPAITTGARALRVSVNCGVLALGALKLLGIL